MPKKVQATWPFMVRTHASGEEAASPAQASPRATQRGKALDLVPGVFTWADPHAIAVSLKGSADRSERRRATAFQSAMSVLSFHINRAGTQLTKERRAILEAAKEELRELYGRPRPDEADAALPPGLVERRAASASPPL